MLFNINTIAGQERDIRRVGRYFNLLSSSAGKVRIRVLDAESREVFASEVLNGDAIELDRPGFVIYVSTETDATAVIFWSQTKLKNNGVTVQAPGAVKTSVKIVSGVTKVNSIAAQNQKVSIRANKEIFVGGPELKTGARGWKLAANSVLEIGTTGDIYASKAPLDFDIGAGAQSYDQLLTGATSHGGGVIIGENENIFVRRKPPYQSVLVKSGVQSTTFSIAPPFSGFGAVNISDAVLTFAGGYFYIYIETASPAVWGGICRTRDFEIYEPVRLLELSLYGIANIKSAGSPAAIHADGNNVVIQRSDGTGSYTLFIKENGVVSVSKTVPIQSGCFVDKDGLSVMQSSTSLKRYNSDLQEIAAKAIQASQAQAFTDAGDLITLNGPNVRRFDKAGEPIRDYILPSVGTGFNNFIAAGANFILCASATVANKINLKTGAIENVTLPSARPASQVSYGAVLKTATGHAAFEVRDDTGATGFYQTDLQTLSGSIESAEAEIMELF